MSRRSPHRNPAGLLVDWQPTTPADYAAVARIAAANVLAVAAQRIVTAVRNDRTADLTDLLAAVPAAYERLRGADANLTTLVQADQPGADQPGTDRPNAAQPDADQPGAGLGGTEPGPS
jgi:hypothetical protein